jgi:starch-binding outer membrane protein, SusD/RagB family
MNKIYKSLLLIILPLGIHAQNDSIVSATMKQMFSELCSREKYSNLQWVIGECTTDNSEVGGAGASDIVEWQNMMLFNYDPCNSVFAQYWMRSYSIIAQANKVIACLPKTTLSADQKNLRIAEAKFVRSLTYFDLATVYGGVPIYTDSMEWNVSGSPPDYAGDFIFKARNSIAEVYAQIETDLSEAIPILPFKSQGLPENYFATKGAAQALIAKMYLYQSSYAKNYPGDNRFAGLTQQWDKALQFAEYVINSGEYELVGSNGETYNTWWDNSYLYKVTPAYRYLFTKAANDCSEAIFEVANLFSGEGWFPYTMNGISKYTTCRYIYSESGQKMDSNEGWGLNAPTQDLVNEFALETGNASNDPRFSVTIGVDGDSVLDINNKWRKIYISGSPTNAVYRKYETSPEERRATNGSYYNGASNIKVIRFADVILWAAEAALETGNNSKALNYINMVRTRARNSGNTGYPANLNSVTFSNIEHERRLELALEGYRFFDLVRWNLVQSRLDGRYNSTFQTTVHFTKGTNEFFPVPGSVMALANGVVVQNNGYEQLCAHLNNINDIWIKPDVISTIIDMEGKYSSNIFEEPVINIKSSNPSIATITLVDKKLNINYKNLSDGDTTKVTLTMNLDNNITYETSFMIRVIKPLFTANDKQINKIYSDWFATYEIPAFYEDFGLDFQTVKPYLIFFNNGINASTLIRFDNNQPDAGLALGIYRLYFLNYIKKNNLESDDIIDFLVLLRERIVSNYYHYYAIDVPVKVSDITPFISLSMPQLAGNEISFKLSTTNINIQENSRFDYPYKMSRNGFRFNAYYDSDKLEYLDYSFDNSLIKNLTHDVTVINSDGSLAFADSTAQPISGEGELITLHFRDLGEGLGNLYVNNFGYIIWNDKFSPMLPIVGFLPGADYFNILVGNDVIEIGEKPKAAKSSVQLYPNPAVNDISIDADIDNYSIILYSIDGRLISSFKSNSSSMKIPVNNMASGLYIVKIIKDGESQNLKFIKK